MKTKYLVFAGDNYYPGGGQMDFVEAYDDQIEALMKMPRHTDWAHVAELHESRLIIVAEREGAGDLKLYPERMAHVRAAEAQAPGGAGGEADR